MFEVGNKCKRNGHGLHLIIVCDEAGIFDAFYLVKERLPEMGNSFLSLIYTVSDKNLHPLFEKELSILEKRYSVNLIVHILRITTIKFCSIQELIEATINSNTLPVMKFSFFGTAEFVDFIYGVLALLDVEAFFISSKIVQQLREHDSQIVFNKKHDKIIN
jgi:hypothetical protein